tara:strand:- start:317 stop:607 length:291 start_codon:yes stop_codon:yes gene_type:complete
MSSVRFRLAPPFLLSLHLLREWRLNRPHPKEKSLLICKALTGFADEPVLYIVKEDLFDSCEPQQSQRFVICLRVYGRPTTGIDQSLWVLGPDGVEC